jgi:prepilin-type N-terminal cleavage/methylation domain-containing protein
MGGLQTRQQTSGFTPGQISIAGAGFTLIELLITSGILLILSAATLISTNISTTERQLTQATQGLVSAVTTAQSLALAPPVEKTIGNAGYKLIFLGESNRPDLVTRFEIREIGSLPGQVPVVTSNVLVREGSFPQKIGFRLSAGGTVPDIVFSIVDQGDILEPKPIDGLIRLETVTRRGGGPSRSLTILTATGQVDVAP